MSKARTVRLTPMIEEWIEENTDNFSQYVNTAIVGLMKETSKGRLHMLIHSVICDLEERLNELHDVISITGIDDITKDEINELNEFRMDMYKLSGDLSNNKLTDDEIEYFINDINEARINKDELIYGEN